MTAGAPERTGDQHCVLAIDAVLALMDGNMARVAELVAEAGAEAMTGTLLGMVRTLGIRAYDGPEAFTAHLRGLLVKAQINEIGAEAAPGTGR